MSCVIGVKAVFHHPTVFNFAAFIAAPDRRLAGTHGRRQDLEPQAAGKTPGQTKSESEHIIVKNLRRQRAGGRDKQAIGSRSGTHEDITDLPPSTEAHEQEDLPRRDSRRRDGQA